MERSTVTKKAELYDRFYRDGQAVLDYFQPCGFKLVQGRVRCNGPDGVPCCQGCRHLTPTGCGVASLGCKLGLCYNVALVRDDRGKLTFEPTPVFVALETLRQQALRAGVPVVARASKEEVFHVEQEAEP